MEAVKSTGAGSIAPEDCLEATPYMDFERKRTPTYTLHPIW